MTPQHEPIALPLTEAAVHSNEALEKEDLVLTFEVNRIEKCELKTLGPRAGPPLQRHQHRSENWTVVSGHGQLFCKNTWHDAQAGTTLYIPLGVLHRARGGQSDLVVIEVQHGQLLQESDIERLEDDYGRVIS